MLNTFIKLGEQLSDGRGEWDDIIDKPNVSKEREKDFNLYVAEIIFDLNNNDIYVKPQDLRIYDDNSPLKYKNIKIQGGNNKAIYCCVEGGKTEQIGKTFFGVTDSKGNTTKEGQFSEAIRKDFVPLTATLLFQAIQRAFLLKEVFERKFMVEKEVKGKAEKVIDEKLLNAELNLSAKSKVVLYSVSIIDAQLGITTNTPFSQLEGFETFIKTKFLDKKKTDNQQTSKLCYATGELKSQVSGVEFPERYNINKMFVKETRNYAAGFDRNSFDKNYQVNSDGQLYLNRASKYLLDTQKIKIAGIDHCIIPQFLKQADINIKRLLKDVFKKSELLFQSDAFESLTQKIRYKLDEEELYWITFLAFESDGNYFKTISEIKDVSKLHFNKVIETFAKVDHWFKNDLSYAVDWQRVMLNYGKALAFNLNTVYSLIPQRKDKEKKNDALVLFKSILEQRPIPAEKVFTHFCSLVLCHYYRRYETFKNIKPYDEKGFDFAIRDAVYKYFAFLTVLKQLNLLDNMEETTEKELELIPLEEVTSDFGKRINTFFTQMSYTPAQKAMFYLGRMLSTVAYIQKEKKKNVLEKVNFNGMDKEDIQRLRNSLIEKAKQYGEINKVVFNDSRFTEFFDYNNWKTSGLKPEEAVFFLLSGYSFGLISHS